MYSSEDFERLFIRNEGESIQMSCHKNNVPLRLFEKWFKVLEVNVSMPHTAPSCPPTGCMGIKSRNTSRNSLPR